MLNSFKENLTKITDLTILFASIFTFLAFVTPKEISVGPIEGSRERISISQSELRDARNALSESLAMTDAIQATVNQLNSAVPGLDPILDSEELQSMYSQIESAVDGLKKEEAESKGLSERIASLEMTVTSERQKISNLEDRRKSSKSISWVQPIRKNVESLATAAGMDGILAGFSALIFCLVCKRRKQWFKNIFRIFYK
jgi:predicted RNase H-like nuclease (RuvC/YqgF family)